MNLALWILQALLAVLMLPSGALKLVTLRETLVSKPGLAWATEFTDGQIKGIGLVEVAAAVGLIVPSATQHAPLLTPVAAACLAIRMLGAAGVHRAREEPWVAALGLAALCVLVALGRLLLPHAMPL